MSLEEDFNEAPSLFAMRSNNEDYAIYPLPVLQDNIIWLLVRGSEVVVVDPAVSNPVANWIEDKRLNLKAILQTHHHQDHIGGSLELKRRWPQANIIASKADIDRIPFQTLSVCDGDEITLLDIKIKILEVPAHTNAHVAYYIHEKRDQMPPVLFCGDTLFGAGCGKIFEGTYKDMYQSLQRIKALPLNTKIYCAHEYTEDNLLWANSLEPKNRLISKRLEEVRRTRGEGLLTLPSSIQEEMNTNLFLLAQSPDELGMLRQHKDNWCYK